MGICTGKLGRMLGVDREGSQHAELSWWRDEGGLGGRIGMRDVIAECAIEQVEGGDVYIENKSINFRALSLEGNLLVFQGGMPTVLFL